MAGTFKLSRAVNTPLSFGNPDPIAIADFDNDGAGDVATASPAGSKFQLGVYLNDGDQTFTEATVRNDVPKQDAIAAADLNGDGNADLLQVSSDNQSATVLFGDGAGAFPNRTQLSTAHNPKSVEIADMNGDGARDLVIGTNNRGGVNVFLGDGAGGFTEAAGLVANVRRTTELATGDFNNDGRMDVIAHDTGRVGTVQLLAGDGQGGFSLTNSLDLTDGFSAARGLVVGDFDHDGNLDWAVAERRPNKVEIMFGDGAGGVADRTEIATDAGPVALDLRDFDQDGENDLAVTHAGSDTVRLYQGARDGSFTLAEDAAVNGDLDEVNGAAAGDLDGDGLPDLALANAGDSGNLSILENLTGANLPRIDVDLQWTAQIGTDGRDKVIDTAVTSTGDLVVVSREKIRSGDDRVTVEKYDAQGNELWSRDFGNSYTSVNAVELDGQDNIYFTGEIDLGQIGSLANHFSTLNSGTGNYNGGDPYVAKFSSQGEQQFFERFGSPDVDGDVTDLAVREDGTVYVTARATGPFTPAQKEPAPTNDVVVSAFSAGGDLAWSQMIGAGGGENASKIALDPSTGDLIVAGRSDADMSSLAIGGGDDFTTTPPFTGQADDQHQGFLLRLDAAAEGQVTAVRQFELRQGADSIDGLNVDAQGQVTVVGDASDEGLESGRGTPLVNGIQIPYARRFDSEFRDVWTRQDNSRNDVAIGQDGHSDVVEGPAGFTYVSGGARAHMSVYNDNGTMLADVTDEFFSLADKSYDDGITTLSPDGMSLYVGGGTNNAWAGTALGEQDGWLARLDVALTEPGADPAPDPEPEPDPEPDPEPNPEPEPVPEPQTPQARVFLAEGRGMALADAAEVFGRSGAGERVFLADGVAGVRLDANVERVDLATPFEALDFAVRDDGLAITEGSTTIASLPSLNQDLTLRFGDGSASLRQTGAQRFELAGGDGGTTTVDGNGADTDAIALGGDSAAAPAHTGNEDAAGSVFLNADGRFTLADPAEVIGRAGGDESLVLAEGATGVTTGANIERIDLPRAFADLAFDVTDAGFTLSAGGMRVATLPSLNQSAQLRFSDGDASLSQTGAQAFEMIGGDGGSETIRPGKAGDVEIDLGDATAAAVELAGMPETSGNDALT